MKNSMVMDEILHNLAELNIDECLSLAAVVDAKIRELGYSAKTYAHMWEGKYEAVDDQRKRPETD